MKYTALILAIAALAIAGCQGSNDTQNGGTATTSSTTGTAGATASNGPSYTAIQDAFTKNCVSCHSGAQPKAGLDLTSYDAAIKGGTDGAVIKPGDPDGSLIVQVLAPDHKPHMPPKGQIDAATETALKDWIKAGAKNG